MTQPKPTSTVTAHLALSTVAILYGINYFTVKWAFPYIHSWAVLSLRAIVATAFFVTFHRIFIKEKIRKQDIPRLILCAIFGISLNQFFFLWGLSKTSEVNASVLMITTPVFVFLVAALLKEEKFSLKKVGGLVLSFLGAGLLIVVSAEKDFSLGNDTFAGDLMITINAMSYGIYLVLVRPLILRYNTLTIITWLFIFGSIFNIPVGISDLVSTDFAAMPGDALFGLFFILAGATITAYFLNAWAMKRLPASAVGVYIYVQPVFVTLISALFLAGSVSWQKIGLIVLIMAGVYLVTRKSPQGE